MVAKNNKRLKANVNLRMFFVFLILTFVFWMLIKLSKSYTSEVVFEIEYVDLPVDRVFQEDATHEVIASVQSTGFNLLKYKIYKKKLQIDASNLAYKKGTRFYYLPNNHLDELGLQLNDIIEIKRIYQDTLFMSLGFNKTKKVPVKLDVSIQFKLGYNFVERIKVIPDSVEITAPEAILDTINFVLTEKLEIVDVSSAIKTTVKLLSFVNNGLAISNSEVELTAEVDKFTEGSITTSFEIVNLPKGIEITTFPKEIQVFYKVGLKNYSKITKENMKVFCDFKRSSENNLNYLIPQIQDQSSLISSVRLVPNKIEFLIKK